MKSETETWKNKDSKLLFKAVLSLESVGEVGAFFRDLMTPQEIETFAERFKVAVMLSNGVSYREIYEKTGVSTATTTRVNQWLERGEGGYKLVISRLGL